MEPPCTPEQDCSECILNFSTHEDQIATKGKMYIETLMLYHRPKMVYNLQRPWAYAVKFCCSSSE